MLLDLGMLTAAITGAVAGLLALFGIKPGPYLVGVAVVVKIAIVVVGMTYGARWMRRRAAAKARLSETPPPA